MLKLLLIVLTLVEVTLVESVEKMLLGVVAGQPEQLVCSNQLQEQCIHMVTVELEANQRKKGKKMCSWREMMKFAEMQVGSKLELLMGRSMRKCTVSVESHMNSVHKKEEKYKTVKE